MLNHADGLHLEKFTDADLDQIADCDDILEIDLRSNRTAQPVDLSRLTHIRGCGAGPGAHAVQQPAGAQSLAAPGFADHCVLRLQETFEALNGLQVETLFIIGTTSSPTFRRGSTCPGWRACTCHNRITDLSFVASYPTLKCLHVDGNRITDLAPLADCAALETMWINDNPLTTLAPWRVGATNACISATN